MVSRKLHALASSEPAHEPSAAPRSWPQLVFAREDATGSQTQIEPAVRILVVEDNFLVAAAIETTLANAGFEIAGLAASADEATELAESQRPALVVMDVRLAGESDGIHAALEIFQKFGIRCIFATAHYDQHALERAAPAMPLGWLQKPYSMLSLLNAVRRALRELDRSR